MVQRLWQKTQKRTKTDVCNFYIFCVFVFFVITFVPIKIQTHSAPQNDRLDLSFVKDKHVADQKMARYGLKMAIYQLLFFWNLPNLHGASGYIWGHNFSPNLELGPLSTSKWPSEPQFCERYTHTYGKKWPGMGVQRTFIKEDSFVYRL